MQKRIDCLRYVLMVAVAIISVRLFLIQIVEHDDWVERAANEHVVQNTILAKRGEIYMMDGETPAKVVLNRTTYTIIVDPMIADAQKTQKAISSAVKEAQIDWNDVFADRERRYYVVARGVSRQAVADLKEEELIGVWYQEGTSRVYPEGELGGALLGFVNNEGVGQYGVEGALNKELSGKNGVLKTVTDVNNVALSIGDDNVRIPAEDGENIVLSIDRNMQRKTEKILAEAVENSEATHASAIIMDPNTGKVWTMANVPSYNPEKYAQVEDGDVFINSTVETAYEPASMCKTFAFAAAVDRGVMNAGTMYDNYGYLTIDDWRIANAYQGGEVYGTISMQTALNYSLNTGSMTALKLLGGNSEQITQAGKELLYEYYYDRFGLGQYTGIELYESPGYITAPDDNEAYDSRYANMTFGQGLSLSMIQVAAGFSSVINGGYYYTPSVVAGKVENGVFKASTTKAAVRQTVSEETSAAMREMLWGTRRNRRLYGIDRDGYYVGGKTGTAQGIKEGQYTFDETVASYVGFGGRTGELPEYVVMVKIWGEGQKIEGERHALPIFDSISRYVQDYLQIQPSN